MRQEPAMHRVRLELARRCGVSKACRCGVNKACRSGVNMAHRLCVACMGACRQAEEAPTLHLARTATHFKSEACA